MIKVIHSDTSYVIDFGEGKVATLHPGCIEMPSDQGAEVDSLNNDKRMTLHIAVLNPKIEIVVSLVKVSR